MENFENITIPAEGLELPIATPNYYTTAVRLNSVALVNNVPIYPRIESRNPCVVKLVNSSGQAVSATVDISWQGFEKELI
jgi:hypothetical protein